MVQQLTDQVPDHPGDCARNRGGRAELAAEGAGLTLQEVGVVDGSIAQGPVAEGPTLPWS